MAITKKEIKPIISFISNKYNIPFNNLRNEIENIINSVPSNNDYNPLKCHAYIMVNGNKVQCSRSKKEDCGDFCKTHHRHNNNNELRFGKIDLNKINKTPKKCVNISEEIKEDHKKKKVEVEYISIDDIDYLYNPITKYIYDFETHYKIGKLDNDMNIIKKNINITRALKIN